MPLHYSLRARRHLAPTHESRSISSAVGRVDSAGLALLVEWSVGGAQQGAQVAYRNLPPVLGALAGISDFRNCSNRPRAHPAPSSSSALLRHIPVAHQVLATLQPGIAHERVAIEGAVERGDRAGSKSMPAVDNARERRARPACRVSRSSCTRRSICAVGGDRPGCRAASRDRGTAARGRARPARPSGPASARSPRRCAGCRHAWPGRAGRRSRGSS